jgi:hypothetical protein
MITCQSLDGFTDKLCDITREMTGMERAKEATALLHLIETVPQRFLMQWRAAAVADLHYLEGKSLRSIADELGLSFQAVSFWLRDHGPTHYLTISLEAEAGGDVEYPVLRLITVDGENTKVKVRQYRAAGRKIVPAVMNLVDQDAPGGIAAGIDAEALWNELG